MITSYLLILNDTDIDILNSLIYSPDLSDIIPDTRIDYYRNYKYPLHRVLSLSADLLCIYSLSLFIEKDITGYDIERPFMMKPYLHDYPDIDFSYSHTDKAIFCAISDEGNVGADIENTRQSIDYNELMVTLYPEEKECLGALFPSHRREAFLSVWTKKEAYTKCLGKGLSISPETINTLSPDFTSHVSTDKYGDYIYSLFFSTSAGVNLFNLLTSSELITKYRTRITIYATT